MYLDFNVLEFLVVLALVFWSIFNRISVSLFSINNVLLCSSSTLLSIRTYTVKVLLLEGTNFSGLGGNISSWIIEFVDLKLYQTDEWEISFSFGTKFRG